MTEFIFNNPQLCAILLENAKSAGCCSEGEIMIDALFEKLVNGYGTHHFLTIMALKNHLKDCQDECSTNKILEEFRN